jgi:hypothetical protein
VDGNEGPAFESIPCAPAFDPDGRLLYAGFQPGKLILIGDGTQLNEFRWASDDWKADDICAEIKFYEGGHFAYATARGVAVEVSEHVDKLKARMFIDGQPGTEYEAKFVTAARVQVLDGKFHSVYEVHREKQHDSRSFIVLDGQEGKPYDAILAGSAHFRGAGEVTFIARSGRKFFQVTQSR